jgi:hypothetical protein
MSGPKHLPLPAVQFPTGAGKECMEKAARSGKALLFTTP